MVHVYLTCECTSPVSMPFYLKAIFIDIGIGTRHVNEDVTQVSSVNHVLSTWPAIWYMKITL